MNRRACRNGSKSFDRGEGFVHLSFEQPGVEVGIIGIGFRNESPKCEITMIVAEVMDFINREKGDAAMLAVVSEKANGGLWVVFFGSEV
jgi:hypothetical protein